MNNVAQFVELVYSVERASELVATLLAGGGRAGTAGAVRRCAPAGAPPPPRSRAARCSTAYELDAERVRRRGRRHHADRPELQQRRGPVPRDRPRRRGRVRRGAPAASRDRGARVRSVRELLGARDPRRADAAGSGRGTRNPPGSGASARYIAFTESRMRWLRTALSLRAKITATFTLIVVGGTVVSTLIGSRIITNALLNQARMRGRQGLEAARTDLRRPAGRPSGSRSQRAAVGTALADARPAGDPDALAAALLARAQRRRRPRLPGPGRRPRRAGRSSGRQLGGRRSCRRRWRAPISDRSGRSDPSQARRCSTADALLAEDPALAELALSAPGPPSAGRTPDAERRSAGLVLFSAVPVRVRGEIGRRPVRRHARSTTATRSSIGSSSCSTAARGTGAGRSARSPSSSAARGSRPT